jgi:hypothetical protein
MLSAWTRGERAELRGAIVQVSGQLCTGSLLLHVFDVAAQHLPQCVAAVQWLLLVVDLVEGAGPPLGAVALRGAALFDDAQQPVTDR